VVAAARLTAMVDVTVGGDGVDEYGDAGHCDPRVVDEAVRRLALPAEAVAVIDQTPAGVRAAHRCGVGMVVAVDPASRADDGGRAEELRAHGADLVVGDLAELTLSGRRPSAPPLR
jgi:beta-phosphoglucomutase-like phosphatase (HAD superfamily)